MMRSVIIILVLLMCACIVVLMYSALIVSSDYDDMVEEYEREKDKESSGHGSDTAHDLDDRHGIR